MPKLIFISGSTRNGSYNVQLAKSAFKLAKSKGAEVELIDLKDYDLPLFNEDLETDQGMPEAAKKLKQKFMDCDGFFVACPEYNSSISPLLKNAFDWISRSDSKDEPMLAAYTDKAAAIGAATPGGLGGLRVLVPLRLMLGNVNVNVVGRQIGISKAHEAFDENGDLISNMHKNMLDQIITQLIRIAS